MDKICKKRGLLRTSFTKTVTILNEEIEKDKADHGILNDKFAKLEKLNSELNECNEEILNILLEDETVTESVLNTESEKAEEYSDIFITIRRLVNQKLGINDSLGQVKSESSSGDDKKKKMKLPKIVLRKFDGELLNYLPFWAQFKEIHENEDLNDCEKFHYLSQSMLPGSRAKEFIDSYPITSENYEKAISALRKRFGNVELLTEVYVRELLKLVIQNVGNQKEKLPLSKLVDKLEAHLRALETMGVNPDNNAQWLFPLIESCLSEDLLKAWHRSSSRSEDSGVETSDEAFHASSQTMRLAQLMKFLHKEVENDERVLLARKSFRSLNSADSARDKIKKNEKRVPTTAGFFVGKEVKCVFCDKIHESKDCLKVRSLPLKEKIAIVKEKRCCLKCLRPGHIAKFCNSKICCHVCSKDHLVMLCPQLAHHKDREKGSEKTGDSPEVLQSTITNECSPDIALMTLEVNIIGDETKRVRVLLDTGSQKSYILSSTAKELNLKPVSTESLAHTLFGGAYIEAKPHQKFHIRLCSPNSKEILELEFLDQEIICGNVPRVPKNLLLTELKQNKIWLSDLGAGPTKIELLIGSDVYGRLLTGRIKQLQGGLTAVETKLGWTVCGPVENSAQTALPVYTQTFKSNLVIGEMKVQELWKLETIGIMDPVETLSKKKEEELAYEIFLEEVKQNVDGRYRVSLPWVHNNRPDIPSNRHIAERRLLSTTKKLKTLNKLDDYDKVFSEWLEEGVIEEVPRERTDIKGHFLPHHPVIKVNSLTTKIRPVFDASCKIGRNPSLNDCLLKGPNLIEQIPAILLRFREKAIGVVSDIKRAFLQIEVKPEDRDYLRFLWWRNENHIQEFQHNRVVFGATCSPFLLGAVIRYHLSTVSEEWKNFAEKLSQSFYVDNCISSVENEAELKDFIDNATEIMIKAKMDLRMWEFGPYSEISSEFSLTFSDTEINCSVPVLGLMWDKEDDSLRISSKIEMKSSKPSKREILSVTQGIFDPIGFLVPALLPAKILIQEAWMLKSEWDAPLPDHISHSFLKWYDDIELLQNIKLPRRVGFGARNSWTLHTFCDASKHAYATVIYLRCEDGTKVSVQLLGAKSRLSPLKKITIPRLELLGCVVGARLSIMILEALALSDIPVYYWTDSTTALAWIRRNDEWGTFVGNRVREICKLTDPHQWHYIPGELNAADLPSRGCSPRQLLESRWWEGPEWLHKEEVYWPALTGQTDEEAVREERKKCVSLTSLIVTSETNNWYCKFSQFSKIVRILGWMIRFVNNARKRTVSRKNILSVMEIEKAEKHLWKVVQLNSFGQIENSCKGLVILKDDEGLIRVKTKIIERGEEFDFRYPILLPSKSHLVTCLITELHRKNCHAGMNILAAKLREKYFVISARRAIRSVITKCIICKRFNSKAYTTPPIHLPLDRVRDAATFEVVGIDLCGPLFLKNRSKVWIVLFTCAVYRAVHLELVVSLSTSTFLQALRRFIARRGRPSTIYTDNGTNFAGADSALKSLNWHTIQLSTTDVKPLIWKFIPPAAAWWGGWWERLIRSVKSLLLRVLGNSSVKYEELSTILCDVEAQINSRPLTYISDSSCDLVPLTPSMFLQDISDIGIPDLDTIDREKLQLRFKHCQKLRDELRTRFRKEYLGQLVQRAGEKSRSLKIGDVVLVGQDNVKRQHWPLARVEKIFPSRDGCPRVAQVKTKIGILVRPIRKLYPLEISEEDPIVQAIPERLSRFGRRIKTVQRLNLSKD